MNYEHGKLYVYDATSQTFDLATTPAVDIILRDEEDRLRDVEGLRIGDVAMMFTRLRERVATPPTAAQDNYNGTHAYPDEN